MGREFKYLWGLKGNCENVILAKAGKEGIIYYKMVHVRNLNYYPCRASDWTETTETCLDAFLTLVQAFWEALTGSRGSAHASD